jgi:mycothiol system anti-sigma-R factor
MTCDELRQLLTAYLDDELDIASTLRVEAHLAACDSCTQQVENLQALRHAVAQPAVGYRAPSALRDRLTQTIRSHEPVDRVGSMSKRSWFGFMTFPRAAAAILLVGLSVWFVFNATPRRGEMNALVDAHLRSLEAEHLLDVESTDQHTVRPWFAGKLDFSPPVVDLAAEGFPLVGGRLDYVDQKKVAVLVYCRNKHVINLLIWPGETQGSTEFRQGFNLIRFQHDGMVCWAISDLNAQELQQFVHLFQSPPAPTTER